MPGLKPLLEAYNPDFKRPEYMQELLLAAGGGDLPDFLQSQLEELRAEPTDKRAKIALEVLAPLANRLNMQTLKRQLEDNGFAILDPEQYELVVKLLKARNADTHKDLQKFVRELEGELRADGIDGFEVTGRTKQPYSLYKKLSKTGTIEDIHDLLALRILAEGESDCYRILDVVHRCFDPDLSRFKDYIKQPKSNGYQSLHTTVRRGKKTLEIQIRTPAMHELAESGQAAHWHYDQHKDTKNYRRGVAPGRRAERTGYIYVFSPLGDVFRLKSPATPLDFAYAVHSNVGARTKSVKINGRIAPLDRRLQNGDQVTVITGKEAKPKRDWLRFVTSRKARGRIWAGLRQADKERYRQVGKDLLLEIFDGRLPDLSVLLPRLEKDSIDELILAVGRGDISPYTVKRLYSPDAADSQTQQAAPVKKAAARPVDIAGMEGLQYRLANCCQPAPPAPITGYITRSLGITVHRRDCSQITGESERLIDCNWRRVK